MSMSCGGVSGGGGFFFGVEQNGAKFRIGLGSDEMSDF